jgi:molybdopterin molybdotransferase
MSVALTGVDLSWDAARAAAHDAGRVLPARRLPLSDAVGTTLAEPVVALVDLPSADRSAMDGFAVRGAPPWTVMGELRAGDAPAPTLPPGSAVAIATGAPVPAGTDAVLPVELSESDGPTVRPLGRPPSAGHIRRRGEECRRGDVLVPAGTIVTPQVAGLAAAIGHDTLAVHPPPRTAALVTGDELRATGTPGPGQVRDAIGPMLPGLIRWAGGVLAGAALVPDSRDRLTEALATVDAQVVLVSGSSSAGPADHLRPSLVGLGADLLVDGVACRPGHPQSLALLPDGRAVVGLPGNPLAALVAFLTLAVPLLAGLTGRPLPPADRAAADGLAAHPTSTRLVPVRLTDGVATAMQHAGSAMLRGVALAGAIAVVPPGQAPPTTVLLLPLPG